MSEVKIISEYNVNRYLYLVPKATKEDYIIKDSFGNILFIAKAGCTLTLHCLQVLDAIASIIREGMEKLFENDGLRLNQVTHNFKLMEYPHLIEQLEDGNEEDDEAQFNMREKYKGISSIPLSKLLKHPSIKTMQRHGLMKALDQLNNFKFKASFRFYAIKDMRGKDMHGGYNGVYSNLKKDFTKLFDVKYEDGKDPNILFDFNTVAGYIFSHNIYTKGFSYQNETFEKIKKCGVKSKLVFRRFILPFSYSSKLTVEKVITYLGIKPKNKWLAKKILDSIVKELVDNELIEVESQSLTNEDYHYKVKKVNI